MPPAEQTPLLERGTSSDPHNGMLDDGKVREEEQEGEEGGTEEERETQIVELLKFRLFFMFFSCRRGFISLLSVLLRQRGFTPWQIGAIRTAIHFPRVASRSLVTYFADRFQIRKTILILSILSWTIGYGAFVVVRPRLYDWRNGTTASSTDYNCTDSTLNEPATPLNCSAVSADVLDWLYPCTDLWMIFMQYIVIAVLATPLQGVTNPLSNAAVLDSLGSDYNKYGWHKAFGGVGNVAGNLIASYLLSIKEYTLVYCGISVILTEFWGPYLFYASALMSSLLVVACWFRPKDRDTKSLKNTLCVDLKKFGGSLQDLEITAYLVLAGWMGLCSGISTGFLFWHVATIGSSFIVIGVIGAAASIASTLAFASLPIITRLCNHTPVTVVALTLVSIRFLLYAWLANPWWYIVAHSLKGISNACLENNGRIILSNRTESSEYSATMQSLFSAATSLGTTLGTLIGGVLISEFGAPVTFASTAIGSCIINIVFICLTQIARYREAE